MPRSRLPTVLLGALAMLLVLQPIEFLALETRVTGSYRVVDSHDGLHLREVVRQAGPTSKERFALYLELRDIAQGTTLIMPEGLPADEDQLVGLAGVEGLRRTGADLAIGSMLVVVDHAATMHSGHDRALGDYRIVAAPDGSESQRVVAFERDEIVVFAPCAALSEDGARGVCDGR